MGNDSINDPVPSSSDPDSHDREFTDQQDPNEPVELAQRALPRISIAWMMALITASALVMVGFRMAYQGNPWALGFSMLVAMTVSIFAAYAVVFSIGFLFHIVLRRPVPGDGSVHGGGPVSGGGADSGETSRSGVGRATLVIGFLAGWSIALSSGATAKTPSRWIHGNYPIRKGLGAYTILVGTEPAPGLGGYRQVFFDITPLAGTFGREHHLRLSVQVGAHYEPRISPQASLDVTMRQGDSATTQSVLVPNMAAGDNLVVRIYEDGELISRKPWIMPIAGKLRFSYANQNHTIGIIDPAIVTGTGLSVPDVRTITSVAADGVLPEDTDVARLNDKASRKLIEEVQPTWIQYRLYSDSTLSEHWLAYSDLDIILVDGAAWDHLADERPVVRDAILKMVAAGGHLWIYGQSDQGDRLVGTTTPVAANQITAPRQVQGRLKLNRTNDTTPLVSNGWNSVTKASENYGNEVRVKRQKIYDDLEKNDHPLVGTEPAAAVAARIRKCSYGIGSVVRIDDQDPFPGSFQFWNSVVGLYDNDDLIWQERNGYDARGGNTNYWRWLIPSVGGPPVKSFLTLNSLFAILVGPMAYVWLRRNRRLYLLYFLAPLAAVTVMGGLFAFAVVSDGLGTRGRIHQFSLYDQTNQVVVHADRQTIYSAFGSGELRFDAETMVTTVSPVPAIEYYRYNSTGIPQNVGRIEWADQSQIYRDEFVPTRSQVQYVSLRPAIDDEPIIRVSGPTEAGQVPQVNNAGDQLIEQLFYRDSAGKLFVARSIPAGETKMMESTGLAKAPATITTLDGEPLVPPVGYIPQVQSGAWFYRSSPTAEEPSIERMADRWQSRLPKGCWIGTARPDPGRYPSDSLEISQSASVIMGRL